MNTLYYGDDLRVGANLGKAKWVFANFVFGAPVL